MIVLEGPDGGGKTTLAKRLCEELDLTYMKPPPEALSSETGPVDPKLLAEWWYEEISNSQRGMRKRHVYDRSTYISDPIYRLIFGDESGSTVSYMGRGIHHLANYATVIFCLPGQDQCYRSAVQDHERENLRLPDEARHKVLYWAYECMYALWWEALGGGCFRYDWSNYSHIREVAKKWVS